MGTQLCMSVQNMAGHELKLRGTRVLDLRCQPCVDVRCFLQTLRSSSQRHSELNKRQISGGSSAMLYAPLLRVSHEC